MERPRPSDELAEVDVVNALTKIRDLASKYGVKNADGVMAFTCHYKDTEDIRKKADFTVLYNQQKHTIVVSYERRRAIEPDFHPVSQVFQRQKSQHAIMSGYRFQLTFTNGQLTDRRVFNASWGPDDKWSGVPSTNSNLSPLFMLQSDFLEKAEEQKCRQRTREERRLRIENGNHRLNSVSRSIRKGTRKMLGEVESRVRNS